MAAWHPVRSHFVLFTKRFEGWFPWLYENRAGFVATGVGYTLDTQPPSTAPTPMCLDLPWMLPDGSLAQRADITAAWRAVRARRDLRALGGQAYQDVTPLRLPADAIAGLVLRQFDENDAILSARFTSYSAWPADGQLALHSMAWSLGSRFRSPRFEGSADEDPPNFAAMARQCAIPGGLPLRNTVNAALFEAAAVAQRDHHPDSFPHLLLDASSLFGADPPSSSSRPYWGRIAGTAVVAGAAVVGVSFGVSKAYAHFRGSPS